MLVLGLETSCDETAAAVVADGRRVCSDVVASQVLTHAEFGGVVPEVASRQHLATVAPVVRKAVADAGIGFSDLDGIAVTRGPGLVGALLVGVEFGKALGFALGRPVVGVNHLAGHLAAVFLDSDGATPPPFPHLALLVSGGHTILMRVNAPGQIQTLGCTRDDAAGEAFDKVGKLLGLGYPGGVCIDALAVSGQADAYHFPRALPGRDDLDFSFSGLKTAVATHVAARFPATSRPSEAELADLCASFQAAVVDVLVRKSKRALAQRDLKHLVLCGGVAANRGLRSALLAAARAEGFTLHVPAIRHCTDNAAMIAAAGTQRLLAGERDEFSMTVDPSLPL